MQYRLQLALLTVAMLAGSAVGQANSDSKRKLAWDLGSSLSLAAVLHAQGAQPGVVNPRFAAASSTASKFGLRLPALPVNSGTRAKDSAAILNYLLNTTGGPIGTILQRDVGPAHAGIFEIALKSNILLLMYSPGDSMATTIANVIRQRQVKADLPAAMFEPLLGLVGRNATYEAVKAEAFRLHEEAPLFIAIVDFSKTGEELYAAGNALASAAEFTKAIAIDPTGPEHYYSRGRAYLKLGKHAEAIADYSKFLQLESREPRQTNNLSVAYHNRGLSYGVTGKNTLAIADLTQAIKLRPDYASAYKVRGFVYRQMGNAKLAAADLQKAEQLQPGITK